MKRLQSGSRLALALSLALLAFLLAACANQRRILEEKATTYLDCEIKQRWNTQFGLYSAPSQQLLFQPYKEENNPLRPAVLEAYKITNVALEGNRARVSFTATISTLDVYTGIKPGEYELNLHFVDQQGNWMVDELATRREWITRLKGESYADLWMRQLESAQYSRPR